NQMLSLFQGIVSLNHSKSQRSPFLQPPTTLKDTIGKKSDGIPCCKQDAIPFSGDSIFKTTTKANNFLFTAPLQLSRIPSAKKRWHPALQLDAIPFPAESIFKSLQSQRFP